MSSSRETLGRSGRGSPDPATVAGGDGASVAIVARFGKRMIRAVIRRTMPVFDPNQYASYALFLDGPD